MKEPDMSSRIGPAVLTAAVVAAVGGCNTTVEVRSYPVFYSPNLTSIAVPEFANASLHPRAAAFVTERVVAALKANGTYKTVLGPRELNRHLAEANAPMPAPDDRKALAAAAARAGAQAVLLGTVRTFAAERTTVVDADDDYGPWHGRRYSHGWYGGYRTYTYRTYTRAVAAADVALLDPNGAVIYAPPAPLTGVATLAGGALSDEALAVVANALAAAVLDDFAVVNKRVPVSRRTVLRTAAAEGGGLRYTDNFAEVDKDVIAVVNLPPPAALNEFRLAVFRRGQSNPLALLPFTWRREDRDRRFEIAIPSLGAGEFDLRLYHGNEKVEDRAFRIGK
jgi:hypothetical protein